MLSLRLTASQFRAEQYFTNQKGMITNRPPSRKPIGFNPMNGSVFRVHTGSRRVTTILVGKDGSYKTVVRSSL